MADATIFNLTVAYSMITGSAAGLLSLLTWETLRRSPFGRAVFVLTVVMFLFIIYHVLVLVLPARPGYAVLFKSAMFTGVAVFIWMLIWSQHRLRTRRQPGQKS